MLYFTCSYFVNLQARIRGHVTRKWLQQVREEFEAVVKETDDDPHLVVDWLSQRMSLPRVKKKRPHIGCEAANPQYTGPKPTLQIAESAVESEGVCEKINPKSSENFQLGELNPSRISSMHVDTGNSCSSWEKSSLHNNTCAGCDVSEASKCDPSSEFAQDRLSEETAERKWAHEAPPATQPGNEAEANAAGCPELKSLGNILDETRLCNTPYLSGISSTTDSMPTGDSKSTGDPVANIPHGYGINTDVSHTLDGFRNTLVTNMTVDSGTRVHPDSGSVSHDNADVSRNVSLFTDATPSVIPQMSGDLRASVSNSTGGAQTDVSHSRGDANSVSLGNVEDSTQHWGDSTSFWDADISQTADPESQLKGSLSFYSENNCVPFFNRVLLNFK